MKLGNINVEEIKVEERAREELGDLTSLIKSFEEEGIIQPLAVEETSDGYILLAGGRRFEAARRAKIPEIPVRIYEQGLSPLMRKSIELAENLYRKDLTWQEEVKLKRKVHDLQLEMYGEKTSTSRDAEGWSKRDTSKMLGESPASTVQDIQLAEALGVIPEIEKAKTKHEATKMLKKVGERIVVKEIAKRVQDIADKTPRTVKAKNLVNSFIIKDFFEGIADVADGVADVIELDPPYGIDLKDVKKSDTVTKPTLEKYNEIEARQYKGFMKNTLEECYRILGKNGWLICWFGPEPWFQTIYELLIKAGFTTRRIPGIWAKPSGQTMQPGSALANCYEMFFYARKGNPAIIQQGRSNIYQYKPVPAQQKRHPTERPIELMQDILGTFCSPLSRAMIPFLGSGNTMFAAANLGMSSFGYELAESCKDSFTVKAFEQDPPNYKSYR